MTKREIARALIGAAVEGLIDGVLLFVLLFFCGLLALWVLVKAGLLS